MCYVGVSCVFGADVLGIHVEYHHRVSWDVRLSVVVCVRGYFFFFQAEDGIRDLTVTGVQTCALPISTWLTRIAINEAIQKRNTRKNFVPLAQAENAEMNFTPKRYEPWKSNPEQLYGDRKSVV